MRPVPVDCFFVHILYDPSKVSVSQKTLPSLVVKNAVEANNNSPKINENIVIQKIQNNVFFIQS